jgi:hypothetical protein
VHVPADKLLAARDADDGGSSNILMPHDNQMMDAICRAYCMLPMLHDCCLRTMMRPSTAELALQKVFGFAENMV